MSEEITVFLFSAFHFTHFDNFSLTRFLPEYCLIFPSFVLFVGFRAGNLVLGSYHMAAVVTVAAGGTVVSGKVQCPNMVLV